MVRRIFPWLLLPMGITSLYLAFVVAPPEATMADRQRIMYFHVASAWNAYLSFLVVFVASIAYLRTGARRWDRTAFCSAELGVFFTSIALVSGMVWGRSVWGKWWVWEPRLTTTLLLWFIYVGYLLLRATGEGDERRARMAAGLGVIGFVDVPIVHMSVKWWNSYHPYVIGLTKVDMVPMMVVALVAAVLTFTVFYVYMLDLRLHMEHLRERTQILKENLLQGGMR